MMDRQIVLKKITLSYENVIVNDRFILYDNDKLNLTRDTVYGNSRMVELVVDLNAGTSTEVWNWIPDGKDYFSSAWGDADWLANGNSIGTFGKGITGFDTGNRHPMRVTEVNQAGEIVWEAQFNSSDVYDTIYEFGAYSAERYYNGPVVELLSDTSHSINARDSYSFNLNTWNTIRNSWDVGGELILSRNSTEIHTDSFTFDEYWQATNLVFETDSLEAGDLQIDIIVSNEDGKSTVKSYSISVLKT